MLVALEEHLVASHYVGCLVDAVVQALAQLDNLFYTIGREEGIADDVVALLSDTVHTSGSLNESDNRPWQVVVDDDMRILQVLTFAQYIGGDEDSALLVGRIALLVAHWREMFHDAGGVLAVARSDVYPFYILLAELAAEILRSVGVLGEEHYLVFRIGFCYELVQFVEFLVFLRFPLSAELNHLDDALAILLEILLECSLEVLAVEPVYIILLHQQFIVFLGFLLVVFHFGRDDEVIAVLVIIIRIKHSVGIFIFHEIIG